MNFDQITYTELIINFLNILVLQTHAAMAGICANRRAHIGPVQLFGGIFPAALLWIVCTKIQQSLPKRPSLGFWPGLHRDGGRVINFLKNLANACTCLLSAPIGMIGIARSNAIHFFYRIVGIIQKQAVFREICHQVRTMQVAIGPGVEERMAEQILRW